MLGNPWKFCSLELRSETLRAWTTHGGVRVVVGLDSLYPWQHSLVVLGLKQVLRAVIGKEAEYMLLFGVIISYIRHAVFYGYRLLICECRTLGNKKTPGGQGACEGVDLLPLGIETLSSKILLQKKKNTQPGREWQKKTHI